MIAGPFACHAAGMATREAAPAAADSEDVHASVLSQEQFEELARFGERVDEALRLEFVNGRIREKPCRTATMQRSSRG